MDRRAFITTVGGRLLAVPLVALAQAQTTRVSRIGILTTGNPGAAPPANWEGFLQGLRESGYVEGHNVAFEQRYAEGRPKIFPDLAADLVRLKVDVIFARGSRSSASTSKAIPSRRGSSRASPGREEIS